MTLPAELLKALTAVFRCSVRHIAPVGGGCIARACRLETDRGVYFLKWGPAEVAHTFKAEAVGLRALRAAKSPLVIPEVVALGEAQSDRPGFLVLEWIEPGRPGPHFWEHFGEGLAHLHQVQGPRYGFTQDNFIGRMPQENAWEDDWPTFFWQHRLAPQVRWARQQGHWERDWDRWLERLEKRLPELLPARPPASLLHGDLWSGNFMVTFDGRAALIDPAVYYGDRETDLAMTELFGGFDTRFYAAYRAAWPLEPGYEERRELYNLYHLINHLNLFGGSYAAGVARTLRRFA
ncbi:MAG: fructosamine kinase family protein [Rhodothermus sp.]|nr:fructosamine kinase family protein [Rhodothermus sp.]